MEEPKWKRFEKLAYEIQKEFAGDAEVKLNDSILGVDSQIERQIDISVRRRIGQYPILIVIDCKDIFRLDQNLGCIKVSRRSGSVIFNHQLQLTTVYSALGVLHIDSGLGGWAHADAIRALLTCERSDEPDRDRVSGDTGSARCITRTRP